jgi:ABC-type transporter Mla MlaB component
LRDAVYMRPPLTVIVPMTDRMHYQLELAGETATLYLAGKLSHEDGLTLCDLCGALPPSVRTLRLDLHAIGAMSAEATATVRALLHHWRAQRHGEFRLSTSYLLAICTEIEGGRGRTPLGATNAKVSEALTATCP